MEIKKVFTTSKGRFWTLEEANKRANRNYVYGSRPDEDEREPVFESYVLVDGDMVFELSPVEIR